MLPDPEALDRVPARPSASPPTPGPRRRGATSCGASRTLRNAFAVLVALRADDRRSSSPRSGSTTGSCGSLAFVLMGRAHAQFAALMHEAAHRLLFRNRQRQRLGRPLAARLPVVHADRPRTAAATWRTTATSSAPTSPTSRSTAATRSRRASMRRKLVRDATGRTGLKLFKGLLARRAIAERRRFASQARAHRRRAARAHRDRHRARTTRGCTSSCGSRRTSPSGA